MALGNATLTQVDGGLHIAPANVAGVNCVVGPASAGSANVLEYYTDAGALRTARGYGAGVEACAEQITDDGGCFFFCPTLSVAGVAGAVSSFATSPAMTTTGAPNDSYRVQVKVTTGGALGVGQAVASVDGGNTWGAPFSLAATVVLANTGLTLDFAAGTYVKDETASVDCDGPYFGASDVVTAGTALLASSSTFGQLHVSGCAHGADDAAKASACVAVAVAVDTFVALAGTSKFRNFRAIVDAPAVAAAALVTAIGTMAAPHVIIAGTFADIQSPISGLTHKRPTGAVYCGRVALIELHKHPGEVAAGPLPSRVRALYSDDATATILDSARVMTLRTIEGRSGFYITRGVTLAAVGSDYSEHQRCRVVDYVDDVARNSLLGWMNMDLDVKPDGTGQLSDVQANTIDGSIDQDIASFVLARHLCTAAVGRCDRTVDVVATGALGGSVEIVPKGYATSIRWSIGMTRAI